MTALYMGLALLCLGGVMWWGSFTGSHGYSLNEALPVALVLALGVGFCSGAAYWSSTR
jgi:hypothetical protein